MHVKYEGKSTINYKFGLWGIKLTTILQYQKPKPVNQSKFYVLQKKVQ